ncbi:MAG: hypothetical protein ACO3NL_14225, partial [Phycisphaerales bacterium]
MFRHRVVRWSLAAAFAAVSSGAWAWSTRLVESVAPVPGQIAPSAPPVQVPIRMVERATDDEHAPGFEVEDPSASLPSESDPARLVILQPIGRFATPKLDLVDDSDRTAWQQYFGEHADDAYASAYASALANGVQELRARRPDLRWAVQGVPLEGRDAGTARVNELLAPLLDELDAIATSHRHLRIGAEPRGVSTVARRVPAAMQASAGRPVLYREGGDWRWLPGSESGDGGGDPSELSTTSDPIRGGRG